MRAANKSALADAIWSKVGNMMPESDEKFMATAEYILDSGSLLHRIPWSCGAPYNDICECYVPFVLHNYGRATVVFDGYEEGPTTKDATHRCRTGVKAHTTVKFIGTMICHSKKMNFCQTLKINSGLLVCWVKN